MGKPTGFKEFTRELPNKKPVTERLKHYGEFVERYSDTKLNEQAARCMDCGVPFCHNGCPLGNIIPDWNDLVYHGKWREAYERLRALRGSEPHARDVRRRREPARSAKHSAA